MSRTSRFRSAIVIVGLMFLTLLPMAGHAAPPDVESRARQLWQLLDYLAVDYGGAVHDGAVVSASEFAEMQEFTAAAQAQLAELPHVEATPAMQQQAAALRGAVADKAAATAVSAKARAMAHDVLQAYPFPMAPASVPDLQRGAALFQARCAACHGAQGGGDGPLAASLHPRPTALSQHERASQRSLFALQQIIGNGVESTAMPSFNALPEADRWALAFYVGTLPYTIADKVAGEKRWHDDPGARQTIASLQSLTQTSEQALAQRLGEADARALSAYLRAKPDALDTGAAGHTSVARTKLAQSVDAVRANDRSTANKLALSAYLDGFEPIEPMLAARDHALFEKIEAGMMA
ncbi:MAG: cytochrome c, partial [Burkholderiaceae bacterium]